MKPLKNYQGAMRRHQFPPLRKPWQKNRAQADGPVEPAEYQQQLMAGFQQGINEGFEQGLGQGKEQGYQEGLQRGEEEGRLRGKEEGKEQARESFMRAAQPLDALTEQLQQTLDDYEQRRRSELLQLVEKVTRQVIRCELALQPGQMLALVEEALSSLPEPPKRLRVLLNPEEFSRISELAPEKVDEWGLSADAGMAQGECRITTDLAEMDVGCDHRLQQCMTVLSQTLPDAT